MVALMINAVDGIDWIAQCMTRLPERKRILKVDQSFIQYETSTRHGVIRLQYIPEHTDTLVCLNTINNARDCKIICGSAYDILPDGGIIIVISSVLHPGLLRFALKSFDWKYITMIPDRGITYAMAGKGVKPELVNENV